MTTTELGFITIRNEVGTRWLCRDETSWAPHPSFKTAHPREVFARLEARVEDSKRRDCPDNGFLGLWNLRFHPCSQEEADAALARATQAEAEAEAEDEALYASMPDIDWP